ncbi:MAG: DNA methylase [Muribaculaceae bacterium]|nr:DNA methylase [Muribaculaceae bacterium]
MEQRKYIAIDLKSFYASVECVERGLDPLDTCLVVADSSRTEKTICLAVSPALKSFGMGGRPRLFEVIQRVRDVNRERNARGDKSVSLKELQQNPRLAVDYLIAPPRMAHYIKYSTVIYQIYLRFVAPEDIHVYSIDEVFIDVTEYLHLYNMTAHDLAMKMIRAVLAETGITATAGIGSNMYLAKIAMDIKAKKMPPDADGVRIAELDIMSYRREMWDHAPITDFWRVGRGIAKRLAGMGLLTMGDVARCSLNHQEFLYKQFGINAELLIDHAWGLEPVEMKHIKNYKPESHSISTGQVLTEPYPADKARIVTMEIVDSTALTLVDKKLVTGQIVLQVGYDAENMTRPEIRERYDGRVKTDFYGRLVPFHAHGTVNFEPPTSSAIIMTARVRELYDRIVTPYLLVRRITVSFNKLEMESEAKQTARQLSLFEEEAGSTLSEEQLAKERRTQEAILNIKKMFGKNAILKGLNYEDGATQKERNKQIGGHKA